MNKLYKKFLIVLIIIFIIITVLIMYLKITKKEETHEYYPIEEIEPESELQPVYARNNLYAVKSCITKFYRYYNMMYDSSSDGESETTRTQSIEAVYNMLDQDYLTYKNITLDNLTSILPAITQKNIDITDMYVSEKDNISIFFVYGNFIDESIKNVEEFSMIVKIDNVNTTFKVLMQDYMKQKYNDIKLGDNIEINYTEEISNDTYNTFTFKSINNETYLADILKSLKNNMLYNPQVAYEKLEEEYRTKRFPTLAEFEKYVKNNLTDITLMRLEKYQKSNYEDYTQYVCVDARGNYYIINEKEILNYDIILDTYTIDLPQFTEKYEIATDIEKVGLNIDKIEKAVNEGDFQYIYNKLDDTFKKNNFSDLSAFENYFKTIIFKNNNFKYEKIENKTNVYTAVITITNKDNSNESNKLNIIMKLTDSTDFYMSFEK